MLVNALFQRGAWRGHLLPGQPGMASNKTNAKRRKAVLGGCLLIWLIYQEA
jgi:hypothetical protein